MKPDLMDATQNARGDITIRIPRSYLRFATKMHENLPENSRVTHTKTFSDAVLAELRSEEEDGTTLMHRMLDSAIDRAVENGAEGIKVGDDDDY